MRQRFENTMKALHLATVRPTNRIPSTHRRFRTSESAAAIFNSRWWRRVFPMVLLGSLLGCRSTPPTARLARFEFQSPHMGTLFTITLYASNPAMARDAADAAFAKVATLDRMMTDYDPESELMRLSGRPVGTPTRVSAELFDILQESQRVAQLSSGAFDVTVGPVVRLWRRARRAETLPPAGQLARARDSVGWQKLHLDPRQQTVTLLATNMQLDLGGIAKGYAADQALAVLHSRGIDRALVAASGDIAAGAAPPGEAGWRVAIGLPVAGVVSTNTLLLANAAVSTSGDAEQFVVIGDQRYSHIIDPRTGVGLTERWQVSIIARHATQTDAFATAVSVLGGPAGIKLVESQPGLAAIIYRVDHGRLELFQSRRAQRFLKISPAVK